VPHIHHRFRRGGEEMRVDPDLWLCVLDLALAHGWRPGGVDPPEHSYVAPRGQVVDAADAVELARSVERALPTVSDEQEPLTDCPFGEEATLDRIANARQGAPPGDDDVVAARELLSGSPKAEAWQLARFLQGGAFTIHPDRA
jgi:hypothetical protein